jgi:hypothetical protein
MSRSANVLSVQALKDFKVVMANFAEEARNSLGGVDMELRRVRDWLERDQLGYWQSQIKKRSEDLMQARADLHKRKISQQGSDAVSDAEQKEALREAMRRLRVAEEKLALIKRLIPFLHHAIDEYHSHSQPLGDHLSGGFEKSLFSLEKMITSLDAYLALKAPTAPRLDSLKETGASATSSGSSGTAGSASTTSDVDTPAGEKANGETSAAKATGVAETAAPASEDLVSGRAS